MVRNYLKIAFRNIAKQKLFSFINILGLSIGMAASLFVVLYVIDELSYDQFHADIESMYRMDLNGRLSGQEIITISSCPPLGPAMVNEIPEIESYLRIQQLGDVLVKNEFETFVEEKGMFYADSNFFKFFDFALIDGDKNSVLTEPNTVVISEEAALKYFGDQPAVGQQLTFFNSNQTYKVTGVAANQPSNSHLHFRMLLSTTGVERFESTMWLNNGHQTYVKGFQPLDMEDVNAKIAVLTKKHVGPQLEQIMGKTFDEFISQGNAYGYYLRPVKGIHLYSDTGEEIEPGGNIQYVYLFSAIGLFIILIACINFMNLSTAKSASRSKEVGLRKTFGSLRGQLVKQFLVESLIFSIISGFLAVTMVYLLLPVFNNFAGKGIPVSTLFSLEMVSLVVGLSFLVGIIAGSYPAFYLTAFRPSEVLKGKVKSGAKSGRLRGILVVAQFSISIVLIVCTIIVYQQLNYTQNINLGFDRENVIVVENASRLESNGKVFKDKLMALSSISAASYTNSVIPGVNNTTVFKTPGSEIDHIMGTYLADYEHLDALGLTLKEGRNFSREFASDSTAILVNEATVKEMGWENPIGEKLWFFGRTEQILTVIGVVKDFNFESLHTVVRPLVLRHLTEANTLVVRFEKGIPANEAVAAIKTEWEEIAPNELFQYGFLDEDFDALYRSEQRLGKIFYLFTSIAIFIACLGLFGMAAFIAEQRTKEIGIRKALGASEIGISALLSKEFVKYIAFAMVISIYPAYYVMSEWLESFAYRIDISPIVFIISGLVALAIALITVSYQAIRAARVNPVESLKYE
ncbi:MAG: ABC transporter permease [Bacteroidetes bacterium]|nr:MAG: ABC transporter permease [Bacteroidota bacterium]